MWQAYPKAMYRWRAVSVACRTVCPDVVGGLYTPEEIDGEGMAVDPETGGPRSWSPGRRRGPIRPRSGKSRTTSTPSRSVQRDDPRERQERSGTPGGREDLSPRQWQALRARLPGESVRTAAEAADVHPGSVHRWHRKDLDCRAGYNQLRHYMDVASLELTDPVRSRWEVVLHGGAGGTRIEGDATERLEAVSDDDPTVLAAVDAGYDFSRHVTLFFRADGYLILGDTSDPGDPSLGKEVVHPHRGATLQLLRPRQPSR